MCQWLDKVVKNIIKSNTCHLLNKHLQSLAHFPKSNISFLMLLSLYWCPSSSGIRSWLGSASF